MVVEQGRILGGRYRLVEMLGDGGMARVYKAIDERLGRLVAVKTLHPHYTYQPEFVERFEREARLAARLNHPNIVAVHDVGRDDDGTHYMVMEYVEGETLKNLIQREAPLSLPLCVDICRQIGLALDYAHRQGVVHRDIKPENIFLTPTRQVKVGDFGIARALDATNMTPAGIVIGSVLYFSPEQARGEPATAASDLYATGVMLYEMLSGRLPFEGENALAVAMQHIDTAPAPPSSDNPRLAPPVDTVVLTALDKYPARRYPSGAALVDALAAAVAVGTRDTDRTAATLATTTMSAVAATRGATRASAPGPAAVAAEAVGTATGVHPNTSLSLGRLSRESLGAMPPVAPPPRRRNSALLPLAGAVAALGTVVMLGAAIAGVGARGQGGQGGPRVAAPSGPGATRVATVVRTTEHHGGVALPAATRTARVPGGRTTRAATTATTGTTRAATTATAGMVSASARTRARADARAHTGAYARARTGYGQTHGHHGYVHRRRRTATVAAATSTAATSTATAIATATVAPPTASGAPVLTIQTPVSSASATPTGPGGTPAEAGATDVPTAPPAPAQVVVPAPASGRSGGAQAAVAAVQYADSIYVQFMNTRDTSNLSSAFGPNLAAIDRGVVAALAANHEHWRVVSSGPSITAVSGGPDTFDVSGHKTESATLYSDGGQLIKNAGTYTVYFTDVVQRIGGAWVVTQVNS